MMRDPVHTTECYSRTCIHSSAQRNSIYPHKRTHSCEQAMYSTHWSVWSVELWASAAAMCCAPSAPMELYERLYAHACERRAIQCTCLAHDARSHTYTEGEVIYIHAYVHADIPNTNTRACLARLPTFIPVHNAIVYTMHKHALLLRTHASRLCAALTGVFGAWSCEQVMQQCAALPSRLWSCTQGCTHMCV
jgi:hypothetical protein